VLLLTVGTAAGIWQRKAALSHDHRGTYQEEHQLSKHDGGCGKCPERNKNI
jgi:hypothetical protein